MMRRRAVRLLAEAIGKLRKELPGAELLPRDVLDILWLAERMGPTARLAERARPAVSRSDVPQSRLNPSPVKPPQPVQPQQPGGGGGSGRVPVRRGDSQGTETPAADLHQNLPRLESAEDDIPTLPLKAPGVAAPRQTLPIARALRPLRKRIESRTSLVFDEELTAEHSAELRTFIPVHRPKRSEWLDLAVVVDTAGSMDFWWQTVEDVRALLERHNAFRYVRGWRMYEQPDRKLVLRTWSSRSQPAELNELLTSTGRQLIVVISDCVSSKWSDERMADLLGRWSANSPLVVFQVLPPDMWPRTELRHARHVSLRGTAPAVPNALLHPVDGRSEGEQKTVQVPVAALERSSLSQWAGVVAGGGGIATRGVLLKREVPEVVRARRSREIGQVRQTSAEERVARFDRTASTDARDVARLLAAAHFPLTPPIMRLVQESANPGAAPRAIAEVLLSGLMKRATPFGVDENPQFTRYEFTDERVRERLLDAARAPQMLQMLRTKMADFVGAEFGSMVDFGALIADPSLVGSLRVSPQDEPFASIGVAVLRRLGGEYRELARQIDDAIHRPASAAAAEMLASRARLSGRRLSLAELLDREEDVRIETLVGRLDGWGLPVVVLAAIEIAKQVSTDDEERALLDLARTALRMQTIESAHEIIRRIGNDLRADTTPAQHAARAAAFAFRREYPPPRTDTMRAAMATVTSTLARNNDDHAALIAAVRAAIAEDLARDDSLVDDELPVRAWVVVAGTGGMELDPALSLTAAAVGTALARAGFRLISGGWGGVDYITSLSFAIEVELRGESVDERLRHLHEGAHPDFDYGPRVPVTRDWIEQMLTGAAFGPRAEAVITMGGGASVAELIRRADLMRIPAFPLPWTGGQSAEAANGRDYRFGRRGVLANRQVGSAADADIVVDRVVRMVSIAVDPDVAARWSDYTDAVYSLVQGATQQPLDRRAPRLHDWLRALALDGARQSTRSRDELLAVIEAAALTNPDWVVDDFFQLTEFEPSGFRPDAELFEPLAAILRRHAHDRVQGRMVRRFHVLAAPLPNWPVYLLPAAALAFFGGFDALDPWTKQTVGMEAAECFFRASVPFDAYRQAEEYMQGDDVSAMPDRLPDSARRLLAELAPRREYVRRFADSENDAARVIAYAFMRLGDLGVTAVELASRIESESHADRTETRPLRQLLNAIPRLIEKFDATSRRVVARALMQAVHSIGVRPAQTDMQKMSRTRIRALLRSELLAEAHGQNDVIDAEAVRYGTNRGMKPTLERMPAPLRELAFGTAEIELLFRTGSPHQRLLALRLVPEVAGRTPFEPVRQALQRPLSEVEAMLAVVAAERLKERLPHSQLAILVTLVESVHGMFRDDRRAWRYVHDVLNGLVAQRNNADRVRFAPIAVLGSDPSGGAFRDFVRDLGERLAVVDLGVITANPMFGVWLWEGYRRRNTDLESFVVLRRSSDRRPLSEGLPRLAVDGGLEELREELIARAKGAILIGGGNGAFEEYAIARRRGIPIVTIAAAGGAAAEVGSAALWRLAKLGLQVAPLEGAPMSARTATVAANVLMAAVLASDSSRSTSMNERRHAASLDLDALIAEIGRRTDASPRTLGRARMLIEAIGAGEINWMRSLNALRRFDKHVQNLGREFASDMYVAELVARSTYAVALIELSAINELRQDLRRAAAYDRLSVAPSDVVQNLMRALEQAEIPEGRPREVAARLREEIAVRLTTT